ncbi:hypothetical protein JD79_03598 [Geodermatophilus normandii]|uniref:Uncharacterized protein n=1 Tax=Geodermatophilus normandii TaxID=1137989 RepID=A0A317QN06_9ACTN|nr:hypothetical protein [Geodermatophilus normandii]PWW24419.1 hypothetical protein JD79_03598 [Geodermatophilus normandii]
MDSAAGKPYWLRADERRILRRREWPGWLTPANVSFTLSVLAGIAYVVLYEFTYSMLSELGTSPEEVGVNQATLVARAAILGAYIVGTAFVYVVILRIFAVLLAGRLARSPAQARGGGVVRKRAEIRRVEFETRILAASCAAIPAILLFLVGSYELGGWSPEHAIVAAGVSLIFFAVVYSLFRMIAGWRHAAAILAFVLVALGYAAVLARTFGADVAEDILRNGRTEFPIERVVGLEARRVCIAWASETGPLGAPAEGVYLGHANGVSLIVDGDRLLRVRDAQVRALSAPLVGATSDPCDCPARG